MLTFLCIYRSLQKFGLFAENVKYTAVGKYKPVKKRDSIGIVDGWNMIDSFINEHLLFFIVSILLNVFYVFKRIHAL